MLDIIMRAGSFIAIIVMGYLLKKIGFFKEEDFGILSKVAIKITLPCAIIVSFSGKQIDPALLALPLIAIVCGAIYVALGYLSCAKQSRDQQAFAMLNLTGYNIGSFTIPFAQSFLGALGVIAVSIFDTGNAVVVLGGAVNDTDHLIEKMVRHHLGRMYYRPIHLRLAKKDADAHVLGAAHLSRKYLFNVVLNEFLDELGT